MGSGRLGDSREGRAQVAFGLQALVLLIFLIWSFVQPAPVQPIARYVTLGGGSLLMLVMAAGTLGLARAQPWAVLLASPLLLVMLIGGAIAFVLDLAAGRIQIAPIGVLLAAWALRAPPAGTASGLPWQSRLSDWAMAGLLGGAFVLAWTWPMATGPLLSPGGPLVAAREDLSQTLVADCVTGREPPEVVTANYRWSWTWQEPLVAGTDHVVIGWTGTGDDEPETPALESVADLGSGMRQADMAVGDTAGALVVGIDLGEQRFADGVVSLRLHRHTATPRRNRAIEIWARYDHGPLDASGFGGEGFWSGSRITTRCEW